MRKFDEIYLRVGWIKSNIAGMKRGGVRQLILNLGENYLTISNSKLLSELGNLSRVYYLSYLILRY